MGRYAQFNTGFEYKFTFGIQSSLDLTLFGGIGKIDHDRLKGIWQWTTNDDMTNFNDDAIFVLQRLREFEDKGYVLPKFYKYEKNVDGTFDMYMNESFGRDEMKKIDIGDINEFRLGCIIYHQLLYQPGLTVTFDV